MQGVLRLLFVLLFDFGQIPTQNSRDIEPDDVMGITTFHDKDGFQTQSPDHLSDPFEIIGLQSEIAQRFGLMGINAKDDHQGFGLPCDDFLNGL